MHFFSQHGDGFLSSSLHIGGTLNDSHSNSFEVYSLINGKWKFLSPPTESRTRHTMVAKETHIYAIGGEGRGIEPEISMEQHDPAVVEKLAHARWSGREKFI